MKLLFAGLLLEGYGNKQFLDIAYQFYFSFSFVCLFVYTASSYFPRQGHCSICNEVRVVDDNKNGLLSNLGDEFFIFNITLLPPPDFRQLLSAIWWACISKRGLYILSWEIWKTAQLLFGFWLVDLRLVNTLRDETWLRLRDFLRVNILIISLRKTMFLSKCKYYNLTFLSISLSNIERKIERERER